MRYGASLRDQRYMVEHMHIIRVENCKDKSSFGDGDSDSISQCGIDM